MSNTILILQLIVIVFVAIYIVRANSIKGSPQSKTTYLREFSKENDELKEMRKISLTVPLTEKSRPKNLEDIVGQESGVKALTAALSGKNPQHILIYGPPGIGKTSAARLALEMAKKSEDTPFKRNAKFIEVDATTIRTDDRGIADPLIGSVHDPIYQGAGAFGSAGIPQPKQGAVSKAHGGILFIDEIGELHPIEINKLLKVLEDRKVYFESIYYNPENQNIPTYIRDIFENGLPADFRLIGATTRSPEEIPPAIRSRCIEIFFKGLNEEELEKVALNSVNKIDMKIEEDALKLICKYATNGRDVLNLVQLAASMAIKSGVIKKDVLEWIIENGNLSERPSKKINNESKVGLVNGLAVYGPNIGLLINIEASVKKVKNGSGKVVITGIADSEEIKSNTGKIIRKSQAKSSIDNIMTLLNHKFDIDMNSLDIHVNFLSSSVIDGPSAGIAITLAIYSAIKNIPISNKVALTGEIGIDGSVRAIGGVGAKIKAACKAGAEKVIIPLENWNEKFSSIDYIKVIPVKNIMEVFHLSLVNDNNVCNEINISLNNEGEKMEDTLSARSI